MSRNPFVWEVQVRREVLDDEMTKLQELPYSVWRDVLRAPISKTVTGRDSREYRVTVKADFVDRDCEDIKVTLSLARGGLLHRGALSQSFVITPQNELRV